MVGFLVAAISTVWKSRTMFVAWLTFVAGLVGYLVGDEFIAQHPEVVAVLTSVLGIVNMALRFVTTTSLSQKK